MDLKTNFVSEQIELLPDEIEAAISLNPLFQWAKVVICDDLPNLNGKRIPQEEFANLIKTGISTPIKMAEKEIQGHKEAFGKPIGVISQITQETNKLIAMVALWKKERPEDIAMLKDMFEKGTPPNVSWELGYSGNVIEENEVEALHGIRLDGMAIVANPAYAGRTAFVAMSEIEKLEEISMEKIEQLEQEIANLKAQLDERDKELSRKQEEVAALLTYKEAQEKAEAELKQWGTVLKKFKEAGIEKEDKYFEDNKSKFMAMPEESLDFMLQELVAFSAKVESSEVKDVKVPALNSDKNSDLSNPTKLGKLLRENKSK